MATPYLIADSAQVTVLRSLASTAFGKYGLKLPEGVNLEDVYEVAAPGNELAYVSSLGGNRRVGGMFRRFVRADVNITAQGEDMVPASDVERVLDEAAKRVSGDFFLESDITRAGLGPWVPFVDFHVGDIANVEIWGRVVPLVVTRIEPKSTDHSDNDWSVHVGGQLLSDSEARLAENADIYNAVVSDRRELAGLDGKIRAETSNRKSAVAAESRARTEAISAEAQARALADSEEARARQKAISDLSESFSTELETYGRLVEEAKNSVDPATRQVVNFWSKENQNNFNKAVQLTLSAQSAYNDINNIKWVSQDAWNAQQEKINEARDKFEAQQLQINAQNEEFRKLTEQLDAQQTEQIEQITAVQKQMVEESANRIREVMATPAGTSDPNIPVTPRTDGEPGWRIEIPDIVKGGLFHVQWYKEKGENFDSGVILEPSFQKMWIMSRDYSKFGLSSTPEERYLFVRWMTLTNRQVTVNKSGGPWDISNGVWEYIMTHPSPTKTASQATLRLKVTWAAATYEDTYGIRIRAGDRTLKTNTTKKLGPASIFGNRERGMSVTISNATIQPGEAIKVDVFSTATLSGGCRVKSAELTGTWIEEV